MEDSAPITGSPTIDRAIHWVTGNATNSDLLGSRQTTTTSRAMLDFEAAETPSDDGQLQLLIRERCSLQDTVSKLEATVQRAMTDIEAKDQEILALKNDKSPPQPSQDAAAAIAALTQQVAMLTNLVGTMQRQFDEEQDDQPDQPSQHKRTSSSRATKAERTSTQPANSANYSSSSDIENAEWDIAQNETGAACISIFSRSIRYKITDPDRLSDRKDVDGVDSDYQRISEKRPHLINDANKTAGKRGAEIGDLARALHSRLADGLEPQPSRQCSVGLAIFALHDKGDAILKRKLQNALIAARNCKTAAAIRSLSGRCREAKRIPATLLTGVSSFSDSPLTMAIKREALDGEDHLIRALWDLVVLVISLDRNPATTLDNIDKQWRSISCEDVEDALQQELDLHERAEKILRRQSGNKHFTTFSDRVENILKAREKINKPIREKFHARLELDNLSLIEISWDDVWDRIIDADLAASRQRSPKKQPKEDSSPEDTSHPKPLCALHGDCGHTSSQCRDMAKLDADPTVVAKLKFNKLCVWDYYGKCNKGDGCKSATSGESCPFKHLPTKELYESHVRGTIMAATSALRSIAMPALMDSKHAQEDGETLPIPDEPPTPAGLCCGAVIQDAVDEKPMYFSCAMLQDSDSDSSTDSLYQ